MSDHEPVVLELASLPREQVGPFVLLGLDKDATPEQIEAHWAQRVLWARKGRIRTPLEDINWAREALRDAEQRANYEVTCLNVVLSDGYLHRLAENFGMEGRPGTRTGPRWQPLTVPEPDVTPTTGDVPDPAEIAAAIVLPGLEEEYPSAVELLRKAAAEPIDPWSL